MSHDNLEVVHVLIEKWNQGIRDIPEELLDPAVTVESPFSSVAGKPYSGHGGVERWARDIDDQFSEWRIEAEEARAVGDSVISVGRLHGKGRGSGIELDQRYATIFDFGSDHRVTRVRIFWDVDAAREAVEPAG